MLYHMQNKFEITRAKLILSTNESLIGEIRQNMRSISVEYIQERNTIVFYVIYDTPPIEKESDFGDIIINKTRSKFPKDVNWEYQAFVIPYPNTLPFYGIFVYRRYEYYEPSPIWEIGDKKN